MENIRLVADDKQTIEAPCSQCQAVGQFWDRLANQPYCPDCEENLVKGEGPPLITRVEASAAASANNWGPWRIGRYPCEAVS